MPIFDQGYQHWKGDLSGHAWRWLAIARNGVRAQLRNRFVRLLLIVAWLPAVALIAALSVWGLLEQQVGTVLNLFKNMLPPEMVAKPSEYRLAAWTVVYSFFLRAQVFSGMLLVLIVGPNLVSRDLRFNAFPLYFSRPLRRFDYFVGKLGVIGFFLSAVMILPAVAGYLFGVLFSLDLTVVKDTIHLLGASIVFGLIVVLSAGTLMLALSSLSRRSMYVGLSWLGFWVISTAVGGALMVIHRETILDGYRRSDMEQWLRENPRPSDPSNREAWQRYSESQRLMFRMSQAKGQADWAKEAPHDWRPICSYAANLDRMADLLLNTDAAWVTFGKLAERPRKMASPFLASPRDLVRMAQAAQQPPNERMLADQFVHQFPWYWSAGILAGLWVISIWILTFRVRTLDRLR